MDPSRDRLARRGVALLALAVVLTACAPGANPMMQHRAPGAAPLAGFWLGLWHGAIVWVTFIVSLFRADVSVYEVHNTGWPYNLGFAIGAACLHGGGGAGASRRKWRRDKDD
jgi:hypothetical protein